MTRPARYEQIKNMTPEQEATHPLSARLKRTRAHMEEVHGAEPEDYGNNAMGWHRAQHPECEETIT